jgi:hypothetical protein
MVVHIVVLVEGITVSVCEQLFAFKSRSSAMNSLNAVTLLNIEPPGSFASRTKTRTLLRFSLAFSHYVVYPIDSVLSKAKAR